METHSQKYKIRLGLFVAGGITIFILAVFIIGKQKNLFNPVYKLTAAFYNVSGLQVGNNVRFSGINVGIVDNITIINDSTVRVDLLIKKDVKKFIKTDSEVAIGSEGLIGDRLVIVTQGSTNSPSADEGQELASLEPVETDAIIASLQVTAGFAEVITQQLSEIMVKVNSGRGTLGRLIYDSTIAQNLKMTILNFEKTSGVLDETIIQTKQSMLDLMESFQTTASNSEKFSKQAEEVIIKVNSGKGTLGKLIQDSSMAKDLDETMLYFRNSSKGLAESIEAVHQTWPLKRYFRKKAREDEKKLRESEAKNPDEL
jgi:phospholipid/cholesterol/gamma-HCH transport system substrate-binding protein